MESAIAVLIIALGLINIFRMAAYMIAGDWYELVVARKKVAKRSRRGTYEPLVSVVIAAYNEERDIVRTIRSVLKSTYNHVEVIVVDDGSTDSTSLKVQRFMENHQKNPITLIRQANGGKARALNHGIRSTAKGSLIMTLDADSLIHKEAIAKAVTYFRNPRIKAVASNVRIIKTHTLVGLIQYIEYLMGYRLKKAYTVVDMEYIIGGIGSTFRKSILKQVGWYDTDTVTEDIDVTMKIVREGNKKYQVIYGADVITYTQPVPTLPDLLKQRFRWKFGRFQTLFKNRGMFFHPDTRYTKLLTFFQLPFVLFSEFTFLLDPLLVGYVFFMSYQYHEVTSLQGVLFFFCFYTAVTIIADRYTSIQEKFELLTVAPLAYLFFLVISLVEYIALWKCIVGVKGILFARELDTCRWDHVERSGSPVAV